VHLMVATFFYKRPKKNNCIGKKCRNDVQKFTPTKISGMEFRISGGISPGYMSGRNTDHLSLDFHSSTCF